MGTTDKSLEVVSFGEPMVEFNAATPGRLRDVEVFERGFGGDTSNMIVALAKLDHQCGYITKLGADEFGKCLLGLWKGEGVDTSRVLFEENGFTAIYFVSRTEEGRHEFTYFRRESAASHFGPAELDTEYINHSRVFHTSGITQAISTSCRDAVTKTLDELDRSRVMFSYDPNLRLRLWPLAEAQRVVLETMGRADIVFPSLEDAQTLLEPQSPERLAQRIFDLGPKIAVLKLGAGGCMVATADEIFKAPGFSVAAVDTTGAGDAFDAGFLAATLEGRKPKDAAILANAVAALKCLGKGAIVPQPKRSEVESFLGRYLTST